MQLMVPKTQNLDALGREKFIPFLIVVSLTRKTMSPAIKFHRQFCLNADEIEKVSTTGVLPAKLVAFKMAPAQKPPETLFGIGGFSAKPTGKITSRIGAGAPSTPHPNPLPSKGRGDRSGGFDSVKHTKLYA